MFNVKVLNQEIGEEFALYNGDSCELIKGLPDRSIHYSIFSPPFASMYTYNASSRDIGNCKDYGEFSEHFRFLIKELYRVLMDGRLISVHCMDLPLSKQNDGVIGLRDFRGDIIRSFQAEGFIYHSSVCIWKDPVTAMQRTKAIGLLHKQLVKDSSLSRQGIPDYLVTFRKPGVNPEPIARKLEYYAGDESNRPKKEGGDRDSINIWQRYASPVWMDIDPSDTLQYQSARENNDERHICPLQLQVIERGIQLWSNPGDTVLSPFAGIGSEIYKAVQMGRKGIGFELKESYFNCAVNNLRSLTNKQLSLI